MAQFHNSPTAGHPGRDNTHISIATLLVAWDECLGGMVCGGIRIMPTEQNMHHQEKNPFISYPWRPLDVPIQCCRPRPHHSTTQGKWIRCHPHHSRSGVLKGHYIPSLPHDNHWRRGSLTIPQAPIPMVRSPIKSNIRQRSLFHITFRTSTNNEAKHRTKH